MTTLYEVFTMTIVHLLERNAKEFAKYWADKGYEKGESQSFWLSLLRDGLGVVSQSL